MLTMRSFSGTRGVWSAVFAVIILDLVLIQPDHPAAMDRQLRNGKDAKPMFIQIALGSSHAPWVPIPGVIA